MYNNHRKINRKWPFFYFPPLIPSDPSPVIAWMTYDIFAFFLFNAFFACLLYAYEYKNS